MITYYARFIPNLSTITYPLRCLLRQNYKWKWDAACESAFIRLRTEIASDRVLIPYDPELPLLLARDVSPTGVAGIFSHIIEEVERPISFVSRSLTSAEMNYGQLDKEALAIKFLLLINFLCTYIVGNSNLLQTIDHLPGFFTITQNQRQQVVYCATLPFYQLLTTKSNTGRLKITPM